MTRKFKYQLRSNPSGDFCCVPECTISGKFNSSVSFHHFPKDEKLRNMWLRNVRRENLVVGRSTKVCSRHFVPTDVIHSGKRRLREGAAPQLFTWNHYSPPAAPPSSCETTPPPEEESREEATDVESWLRCHDYAAKPESSALDAACEEIEAQQLVIEKLQKKLVETTLKQKFGLERFSTSDHDIRFYTRFASYSHLLAFWKWIEPATGKMARVVTRSSTPSTTAAPEKAADPPCQPSRCLPLVDELFLFLMYLSLGLKEEDLADRFNIYPTAVSRIIKTWANSLYTLLGAVGIWMSPEKIRATMPSVFGQFPDTQVLVDSVEMRCEMPSSFLYKSHTTLKGMIGVSPHGAVTFVSSLFSGSISDKELFWQSGIFPLLDKDMAVMVDNGFRIDELVPCKVYRPASLSKNSQLSHDKVLVTEDTAQLMMHVEKATRRIKENKLFDTIVPQTIAGSINQLFVVACLLNNFQYKQ
nr:PREDICTED: uncharacterized protein LOC109645721 [Paralichthys olivaceus]